MKKFINFIGDFIWLLACGISFLSAGLLMKICNIDDSFLEKITADELRVIVILSFAIFCFCMFCGAAFYEIVKYYKTKKEKKELEKGDEKS